MADGWWILHRMFSFDRRGWDGLPDKRRTKYSSHASDLFEHLQSGSDGDVALAQLLGHKGDLMLTHYARSYDGLAYAQTLVDKLEFREYLDPRSSYVSFLELGARDSNDKLPRRRYACFFQMNGAAESGRSYHGAVTQIVSDSAGLDDGEWAVDLYADDPIAFREHVAQMHAADVAPGDEFGSFWSGVQFSSGELRVFLDGDAVPALDAPG